MTELTLPNIADRWLALWNGNLGLLTETVAEDILIHAVSPDGSRLEHVHGRDALAETIRQVHACFSEKTVYEVGPIIQNPYFVVRWHSTGTYRGGLAGVPDEARDRPIDWRGIDIVRVEADRVAEFWMSADLTVLQGQLAVSS